jgi:hypothetical protein
MSLYDESNRTQRLPHIYPSVIRKDPYLGFTTFTAPKETPGPDGNPRIRLVRPIDAISGGEKSKVADAQVLLVKQHNDYHALPKGSSCDFDAENIGTKCFPADVMVPVEGTDQIVRAIPNTFPFYGSLVEGSQVAQEVFPMSERHIATPTDCTVEEVVATLIAAIRRTKFMFDLKATNPEFDFNTFVLGQHVLMDGTLRHPHMQGYYRAQHDLFDRIAATEDEVGVSHFDHLFRDGNLIDQSDHGVRVFIPHVSPFPLQIGITLGDARTLDELIEDPNAEVILYEFAERLLQTFRTVENYKLHQGQIGYSLMMMVQGNDYVNERNREWRSPITAMVIPNALRSFPFQMFGTEFEIHTLAEDAAEIWRPRYAAQTMDNVAAAAQAFGL